MSGSFIVTGTDRGEGGSRSIGPYRITGTADVGETLQVSLGVVGDNNVVIPPGAVAALILTQPGLPALKARMYPMSYADVGLPLVIPAAGQPPMPTLLPIPPGAYIVIINAAASGGSLMMEFV